MAMSPTSGAGPEEEAFGSGGAATGLIDRW